MPVGINHTRFSLQFSDKTKGKEKTLSTSGESNSNDQFIVFYYKNYKTLIIKNNSNSILNSVTLYNTNGQSLANWKTESLEQENIQIPIATISNGVYIVKLKTSKGEINKKIIIN